MKFRRQVPIGSYVADCFCAEARLIVELDGRSHDGRRAEDAVRERYLRARGLRVVRVTNDDVIHNLEGVGEFILRHVSGR